jgi:branched-chain amino acid transport system permease protein
MWRIVTSPFGLWLKAIRENPVKAAALGVSVWRYRWYAFLISAAYPAVGGALLGPTIGQVDPGLTYWTQSGHLVFMTLLGLWLLLWSAAGGVCVHLSPGRDYDHVSTGGWSLGQCWRCWFCSPRKDSWAC